MAKELIFKLSGTDYGAAPVKLERKKIYGWTDIVATDRSGEVCGSAYLSPDDDSLIGFLGGSEGATIAAAVSIFALVLLFRQIRAEEHQKEM